MRYFNVFGRRQNPDGMYAAVIPKFLKQLLHDEVPTINGDGRQSRDFTYIDNVIEANLKACLASSEAAGEAYNIGSGGREMCIRDRRRPLRGAAACHIPGVCGGRAGGMAVPSLQPVGLLHHGGAGAAAYLPQGKESIEKHKRLPHS